MLALPSNIIYVEWCHKYSLTGLPKTRHWPWPSPLIDSLHFKQAICLVLVIWQWHTLSYLYNRFLKWIIFCCCLIFQIAKNVFAYFFFYSCKVTTRWRHVPLLQRSVASMKCQIRKCLVVIHCNRYDKNKDLMINGSNSKALLFLCF